MKRFVEENGKKIVIVQGKDLSFLDSQSRTPKNIKKLISFEHINYNNREKEFKFSDKEFVDYISDSDFIINFDEFNKLSRDEKLILLSKKASEMSNLAKEVNSYLGKKIIAEDVSKITKKRHDLSECRHCYESIVYVLEDEQRKEIAKKQGRKLI